MPINEVKFDFGVPSRFMDGMRSPWSRTIYVDSLGKGDYATLASALNYVNTVATISEPYIIELKTPNTSIVEVGDFTLNAGVWLKGQGRQSTLIRGTPTMHGGSRMSDLRWTPTSGSDTILYFENDLEGHRAVLDNCYGYLEKNINGPMYGVKCSGSTTDALGIEFIGCKLYVANRQSTGTAAQIYAFHLETGTNCYVHFDHGVIKTSSGGGGVATAPELIWNQGQGVDAYVEITASVWQAFYSVTPRVLRSENLLHVGADLAMQYRFKDATPLPDIVAFVGETGANLYDGRFDHLSARGMSSPYGNHLVVDQTGRGDFSTINAAIAHATTAGASTGARWLIEVRPGIYTEVVDVPSFVTLALTGNLTTINGGTSSAPSVTLHGRAVLVGGNITTNWTLAVRIVGDTAGGVPTIAGSVISATKDIDDVVTAIEITGSASYVGAFANIYGCGTIYARNGHAGPNAKAVVFRLAATGIAVEAYNNHYKLSGGVPGTADLRLGWNQGTNANAQLNITGDLAVYNAVDFYGLYSENTAAAHGGRIHVPHSGWVSEYGTNYAVPVRKTYDVGAHPNSNRYRHYARSVDTVDLTVTGAATAAALTLGVTPVAPTVSRISAAVALAASTTVALPNLSIPVTAGDVWDLEYFIPITVTAGTAGVKPVLSAPAGTTGWIQFQGVTTGATVIGNTGLGTSPTTASGIGFISASLTGWVRVRAAVTITTTGTLDIGLQTGASAAGTVLQNATLRAIKG